jgi:hypothetical protein
MNTEWEAVRNATPDYAPSWTIYGPDGTRVATAFQRPELIAAAPDLLDACKIAYGATAGVDAATDMDEVATARRIIFAAIAKATGSEVQA